MRVEYARCEAQGLSKEETVKTLKERMGLIDVETMRENLHQMVREVYARGEKSSREKALDRDMTPEELYAVISEEIDDIYANG